MSPIDYPDWQLAINGYWKYLDIQQRKQGSKSGVKDNGNRAGATGGKQMSALQSAVSELWQSDPSLSVEIRYDTSADLPAYFRPAKNWDLIVLYRGALIAAMEFKSQRGPSFGNNFNNRTEEALGLAADPQMAAQRGLFGTLKPWFGFLMLVEDTDKSTNPVRLPKNMPFPPDPIFEGESYIGQYRIFFERMVSEGYYDAAALVTAKEGSGDFDEPSPALSLANLAAAISARLAYIKALPDAQFDAMVGR